MNFSIPNPVYKFRTSNEISTAGLSLVKLFILDIVNRGYLRTSFSACQVVDFIVEILLVHRNKPCLPTTAIN